MINERKKLFLFDIDGTLFDNERSIVHSSTIEALKQLKEFAHIGIATGRAEFMLYSIKDIIELFDDFVMINGQYIKSNGIVIYENKIEVSALERICKQMDELNISYGFQGCEDEAVSKLDESAIRSFEALGLNLPPINKNYYKTKPVYQAWVFCDESTIELLEAANPEFQFIKWMGPGYDILPKDANKGLGVKRLGEYLGIDRKDIIVFGDGDNDYEMVKYAGLGIAMGNATKRTKEAADYITDNVSNNGIYKALKHFKYIK